MTLRFRSAEDARYRKAVGADVPQRMREVEKAYASLLEWREWDTAHALNAAMMLRKSAAHLVTSLRQAQREKE